ncbi:MAG: hypothetical protein COA42_20945 [Alteromonadaceae bacterium]|nr:MAG: hypothetical protein COA42_20945 [Alteromonadaceae bacterium]
MGRPEFSLFYYPTNTVYVDDNRDFIDGLTLKSMYRDYRAYTQPKVCLDFLEEQYRVTRQDADETIEQTDRRHIFNTLSKLSRFSEPAILIADYSMPGMNGLDLCSQISNPNIKKILLTGVANERQAINALNTDIIDFYIDKSDQDLTKRLDMIISNLKKRYFLDQFPWSNQEARKRIPYVFDCEFADYFEQTCEDLDIKEHYFATDPNSFIMVDRQGNISQMLVFSENELDLLCHNLVRQGFPKKCIDLLNERDFYPNIHDEYGALREGNSQTWDERTYPIVAIECEQTYFCVTLENINKVSSSYKEFIATPSSSFH